MNLAFCVLVEPGGEVRSLFELIGSHGGEL
jgi:hypothetical protein